MLIVLFHLRYNRAEEILKTTTFSVVEVVHLDIIKKLIWTHYTSGMSMQL